MASANTGSQASKLPFTVVAVLSVTFGAVAGFAYSTTQPQELYTPVTSIARPNVVNGISQIPVRSGYNAQTTVLSAEKGMTQEFSVFSYPPVEAQTTLSWSVLALPAAVVAGVVAWFSSSKSRSSELDVEKGLVMAASTAELRSRIDSVKSSKKITDAMKLVASAKLRRAQEAVVKSRPFSDALQGVFGDVIRRVEGTELADDPLLKVRDVKAITLVLIGGDRGLCGGYNNQLIKRSALRYEELQKQGYKVNCVIIGKKISAWYKRRSDRFTIKATYDCGSAIPKVPQIVDDLVNSYLSEETDTVEVLYSNFISLIKSNPGTRSLLPFKPTDATNVEVDEVCRLTTRDGKLAVECEPGEVPENLLESDMLFEQPAGEILDSLIPLYLSSQLVRTVQESIASELAARMTSMQSASDNAKELGKQLNLKYNRLRQANVTSQLLEIVGGAEASA